MIKVLLTREEMVRAADEGVRRQIDAITKGRKDQYGFNGSPFEEHIMGCMSELAACREFGTYWAGNEEATGGIDGAAFEVRSIKQRHHNLIIHDKDHDDLPYVLAYINLPTVILTGWIFGHEGKEIPVSEPQAGRPCHLVPQRSLSKDWRLLRRYIARELIERAA